MKKKLTEVDVSAGAKLLSKGESRIIIHSFCLELSEDDVDLLNEGLRLDEEGDTCEGCYSFEEWRRRMGGRFGVTEPDFLFRILDSFGFGPPWQIVDDMSSMEDMPAELLTQENTSGDSKLVATG